MYFSGHHSHHYRHQPPPNTPTTQCHAFCQTLHVLLVNYSKREVLCNDDHKLLGPRELLPQFEEPLDVCRHKKPRLVGPPTTPLTRTTRGLLVTYIPWLVIPPWSSPTPPPTRLPFLVSLSHIHNSSLRKEQSEVEPSWPPLIRRRCSRVHEVVVM